jgi:hypothetical protein
MTPEEFISNIYEPTWTWMDEKFSFDVFGTVWSSSFGNRFPDLAYVIPFSEAHISIVESNQKRTRDIAAATAALTEKRVDLSETALEKKAKKKKAKVDARKSKLDAAAKRAKIGLSHDSASDEDEEVRASTNSVEITPRRRAQNARSMTIVFLAVILALRLRKMVSMLRVRNRNIVTRMPLFMVSVARSVLSYSRPTWNWEVCATH